MKEIQKLMNIEQFKKTSSKPIKLLTKKEYCDNIYLESMKDYFGDDVPNCVYEAIESGKHIDYILEDLKTREIIPISASAANDLVYVKNHGKLYHFCTGENANEIEKTGLRSKSGECGCLPERIYAYASCKNLNKIPDIYDKITKLVDSVDAEKYGIYIYRIDLNKSKKGTYINFYADDMNDGEDTVYTYNNIPPECLRLIDIDHTLQKYQLETCNEVADALITSLSDYEVCVNGTKRDFNKVKQKIQNVLNERTDRVGSFNMYVDIMNIDINSKIGNRTLWEWAKAMDKIDKDDKLEEFLLKYKKEFYNTYFKTIFVSDFSKSETLNENEYTLITSPK